MARNIRAVCLILALATSGASVGCAADASSSDGSAEEAVRRARFSSLRRPTDGDLADFTQAARKLEGAYVGAYRFNTPGPEATSRDAREKRIKEVMHRYMCGFFDESIDLGRNTGAGRVAATLRDVALDDRAADAPPADVQALTDALSRVFANPSMDVLSGSASGNNTMGEVMGVYDVEHNEVVFFGYTNCGSDN